MKNKNRVDGVLEKKYFTFQSRSFRIKSFLRRELDSLSSDEVMSILSKVKIYDPCKRQRDEYDDFFECIIPAIENYDEALKYIMGFGYLTTTYISLLKNVSLEFERKMMKDYHNLFLPYIRIHVLSRFAVVDLETKKEYKHLYYFYEKEGLKESNRVEDFFKEQTFTFKTRENRISTFLLENRHSLSTDEVMSVIKRVNVLSLSERSRDENDRFFECISTVVEYHDIALEYIGEHKSLMVFYVSFLKNQSSEFEMKLISRHHGIFYEYVKKHELDPYTLKSIEWVEEYKVLYDACKCLCLKPENRVDKVLRKHYLTFATRRYRITSFLSREIGTFTSGEVMSILIGVDVSDPSKRQRNEYDEFFEFIVPFIRWNKDALNYINNHEYLVNTYVSLIKGDDFVFEVEMMVSYYKIFFAYIKIHTLNPLVLRVIEGDDEQKACIDFQLEMIKSHRSLFLEYVKIYELSLTALIELKGNRGNVFLCQMYEKYHKI